MKRKRVDLTEVERDVLTALSGSKVTASAVTVAADLWRQPGSSVRWDSGDAVGFAAYVIRLLNDKGLLKYRLRRATSDLPIQIRLTPAGWAAAGFPDIHPTVGSSLSRMPITSVRRHDGTEFRNYSDHAQGGAIETLTIPMHRAKYPDHSHPPYYGEPMSPEGTRPYVKVTPEMEATILAARESLGHTAYADIANVADVPERTVKYVLVDLPRLRRLHSGEEKAKASLKERIVAVLMEMSEVDNVPELRRILGTADDEHNIVHVLHSLKQQGRVTMTEKGTGKGYANIRLRESKRVNGGGKSLARPEPHVLSVPSATPSVPEPEVTAEPAQEAPASPAPLPEPGLDQYPLLDALLEREKQRLDRDAKAMAYITAAEALEAVDPEAAQALVQKAATNNVPFPSPLEKEYLDYVANHGVTVDVTVNDQNVVVLDAG